MNDIDLTFAKNHLNDLLSKRQHPKTLCPSEAARALSREELDKSHVLEWRELMPALRKLAFDLRDAGEIEILQKGETVPLDQGIDDTIGPIRLRRKEKS